MGRETLRLRCDASVESWHARRLHLGSDKLVEATLNEADVQTKLKQLGQALSVDGDLLLYGCELAAGPVGQRFIQRLAEITDADVAASINRTGQGGDWRLEATVGTITTRPRAPTLAALTLLLPALGTQAVDPLDAPAAPSNSDSAMYTLEDIYHERLHVSAQHVFPRPTPYSPQPLICPCCG
nr:DUF4347 domain-containing protein [Thiorhodovibrio litoralis]